MEIECVRVCMPYLLTYPSRVPSTHGQRILKCTANVKYVFLSLPKRENLSRLILCEKGLRTQCTMHNKTLSFLKNSRNSCRLKLFTCITRQLKLMTCPKLVRKKGSPVQNSSEGNDNLFKTCQSNPLICPK